MSRSPARAMTESAAWAGRVSDAAARRARVVGFRIIFLTESECSGERLPKAARRVSGSESIYRINGILGRLDRMTGFSGVAG